jgi:regulation of enolase protein 1 (concanavalin A-like superfamily)
MGRFLAAWLLMPAALVTAAPVPKDDAGHVRRVYGVTHDPDKGAEFRNSGGALIIGVPPGPRLLASSGTHLNAPRVWREVRGNFAVSVRVSFVVRPAVPPKFADLYESRAGGGLVLWRDADNFLTLTRDERESEGKPGEYFRSQWAHGPSGASLADYRAPGRSGHLRAERRGKTVECSYSTDGKKWTPLGSYTTEWPDAIKVGVVAENGFKAPFEVAFDQYTLTPAKP